MLPHTLNYSYLHHPDRQFFVVLQHLSQQNTPQQERASLNSSDMIFFAPLGLFLLMILLTQLPWKQASQRLSVLNSFAHPIKIDGVAVAASPKRTSISQATRK